ncbi:MAG: AraC family transcriptional regulator [Planctomycetota bacterium]
MLFELPLGACPVVVNLGVSVHGRVPIERYRLPELWCLHLYRYRATVEAHGQRHAIAPGSVSLVPPDTALVYRFRGRSEHVYVHFRIDAASTGDTPAARVPIVQSPPEFARIDAVLREALGWWPAARMRVQVRLWDVLWLLADRPEDAPVDAVGRITAAIEQRLGDRLVVADLLADLDLPYSHNHLLRLFRERTGQTIVGYIRQRRCERAAGLLLHTSLPIKAIAAEVGVPDPHAFNKMMRSQLGDAPRKLRERGVRSAE